MTKYLLKRILHGLVSIVIVVALVMIMIYTMLDRNLVFAGDTKYSHTSNNARVAYKYSIACNTSCEAFTRIFRSISAAISTGFRFLDNVQT